MTIKMGNIRVSHNTKFIGQSEILATAFWFLRLLGFSGIAFGNWRLVFLDSWHTILWFEVYFCERS